MKALIIDDEKPVRDCINLLVRWNEYGIETVYEAEDGQEAIAIIKREQPDLILTDIRMPGADGLQLMDWIYHNARRCKVIAVSGYTDYEYVRQIFLQGGIDYILKPIQPQKLNQALKNALAQLEQERIRKETEAVSPVSQGSGRLGLEDSDSAESIYYQIKYYIDENYSQELSLSSISVRFHLSESHVSRKFKAMFGITLMQYIKSTRVSHAKKYLLQTGKKVSEIAYLVGYDDEKYFSRVFREFEGISANEYRQKYRSQTSID